MDVQRCWAKVVRTLSREGLGEWLSKHGQPPPGSMREIAQRIPKYHSHSRLEMPVVRRAGKDPESWPLWMKDPNDRRLPDVRFDERTLVGYIRLYRFVSPVGQVVGADYAAVVKLLQGSIQQWKARGMRGLVIDLRRHVGGSIFPALEGLRDVIGAGTRLFGWAQRVDRHGTPRVARGDWAVLRADKPGMRHVLGSKRRGTSVVWPSPHDGVPRVAVIVGRYTASAGEIIASVFVNRGADRVRIFGASPTAGANSANQEFPMGKACGGAWLVLTTHRIVFHDGSCPDARERLHPDVLTPRPLQAALSWVTKSI